MRVGARPSGALQTALQKPVLWSGGEPPLAMAPAARTQVEDEGRRTRTKPQIMSLKYRYETKEDVPAEHMPFYAERDGAFVLDVDGVVDPSYVAELRRVNKSKLVEFRNSNVALLKERFEANITHAPTVAPSGTRGRRACSRNTSQ